MRFTLFLTAFTILYSQLSFAQINEAKLTASDGDTLDFFGRSVSISGDYAIVGANGDDDNGSESGSAYIFKRDGSVWTEEAKLTASDGDTYDWFGYSVAISGDYAIVGAHDDEDNGIGSGSAYIFKRDGSVWIEDSKLTAKDGDTYDQFGQSVSISGDYAIVGAYKDEHNGISSGSAYIFKRDGSAWTEEAKLTASDGDATDWFGVSVSISGDYAIVGAGNDEDNGISSGSAYIFKRDGSVWTEESKLLASDGDPFDRFGSSVSISGDYAIVGAFDGEAGSAYIFKRDGSVWTEELKLIASDAVLHDRFGKSVSILGDYTIVGADGDDNNGSSSGSAYIFKRDGSVWTEESKLLASDGDTDDHFGHSVSISGDYAIVGAPFDDDNGSNSGSAYIYSNFIVIGIEDEQSEIPISYSLVQNFPNPFNPTTTIKYQIPEISFVTLKVYDVLGNEIATLVNEEKPAGSYEVEFDGSKLPSGIYLYQIKAGEFVQSKKMDLIK